MIFLLAIFERITNFFSSPSEEKERNTENQEQSTLAFCFEQEADVAARSKKELQKGDIVEVFTLKNDFSGTSVKEKVFIGIGKICKKPGSRRARARLSNGEVVRRSHNNLHLISR